MLRASFTALLAFTLGYLAQEAPPERLVTGRIVDDAGQPAPLALVGTAWGVNENGTFHIQDRVQASVDGTFTLKVRFFDRPMALLAMDAHYETGGFIILDKETIGQPAEIAVKPLVNVHGTIGIKDSHERPEWTNVYAYTPDHVRLASCSSTDGSISLKLPAGSFQLRAFGTDLKGLMLDLSLVSAQPDHDLGTIELELSVLAQHYGKAPPGWRVSDARGLPPAVKLEDLKGKWVLVDFWAHWCGPCTVTSLPNLMKLYSEYSDLRDQFEIIAFHDSSAKSIAEAYERVQAVPILKEKWRVNELPFPVLLDDTPSTFEGWGIQSLPTTVLIDPEGRLVRGRGESMLESQLRRMRDKRSSKK